MAKAKRKPSQSQRKPVQPVQPTSNASKPVQATAATTQSKQEPRTQRPEGLRAAARAQTQTRGPRYRQRKPSRNPWLLVGGVVVVIAVIVGIFVLVANQGGNSGTSKPTNSSVASRTSTWSKVRPTCPMFSLVFRSRILPASFRTRTLPSPKTFWAEQIT
jgi:hypothetical protein